MRCIIFHIVFLLFLSLKSFSQGFILTQPILEFDGVQLKISYDIIESKPSDQFYVWVEIMTKNAEEIGLSSLTGDVGDNITGGEGKKIIWFPEKDSVFLNEEVMVEVKAERRIKSFNRGSMMLLSAAMPGMGQARVSNGKPLWLAGVAVYGFIAGGAIAYNSYIKTYDSYLIEEDPLRRADLFEQSENKSELSKTLIFTGVTLWIANICWMAIIPNEYKPLEHAKLSLSHLPGSGKGATVITFRLDF